MVRAGVQMFAHLGFFQMGLSRWITASSSEAEDRNCNCSIAAGNELIQAKCLISFFQEALLLTVINSVACCGAVR